MQARGYEPRPSVLATQFNLRFSGGSITFQSASRWLSGKGIPQQQKLVVLADWLKQTPDFLRYGDRAVTGKPGSKGIRDDPYGHDDQRIFDMYRALRAAQKKAVREVILAFAGTPPKRSRPAGPAGPAGPADSQE